MKTTTYTTTGTKDMEIELPIIWGILGFIILVKII